MRHISISIKGIDIIASEMIWAAAAPMAILPLSLSGAAVAIRCSRAVYEKERSTVIKPRRRSLYMRMQTAAANSYYNSV